MVSHSISVDLELTIIRELSSAYTIGHLKHDRAFSWAPTPMPTSTKGEDRFFEVAMQAPF